MKNFKVWKKNICFNPETDDPITIKEIKFVLNKLKNFPRKFNDFFCSYTDLTDHFCQTFLSLIFGKLLSKKNMLYKQHIFDQLSDSMEKKTAEFWKILKSLDSKKLDQNSELENLMISFVHILI
jgi:hypothetical protein